MQVPDGGEESAVQAKFFLAQNVIKSITKYLAYKYPTLVDLE